MLINKIGSTRKNSSDPTYLKWLGVFVNYAEIEELPQEGSHVVEAYQLEDPYDDKIELEEYNREEYYWNEHGRKEQKYMELIRDYYVEARRLENLYYDPIAEKRFLTAIADHITNGNEWYEKKEFEKDRVPGPNYGYSDGVWCWIHLELQQEEGAGCMVEETLRPEYKKVPEDSAGKTN
ncbi:187_t:CDS:2 [Gigaspora rosea]|nr:187_t:CDS:2 [Gigaspora rosea]